MTSSSSNASVAASTRHGNCVQAMSTAVDRSAAVAVAVAKKVVDGVDAVSTAAAAAVAVSEAPPVEVVEEVEFKVILVGREG